MNAPAPSGGPAAEEFERLLAGMPPRHTREQVAAEAGVSQELARRIWRALGFAQLADDAVAFTDADVDALRRVRAMLDGGVLDEAGVIRLARALGQTTARLAQWQAEILIGAVLPPEPAGTDLTALFDAAEGLLPDLQHVLVHVWRAQLAAAGARLLALPASAEGGEEPAHTRVTLAVGFADLVSFTRRARELDEHELADLVEGFESRASDIVAAHGARLVKTLGDEVLFTAPTPVQAARIALDLLDAGELRVGLAYGAVLPIMGDVFGTTVNLAARLTAIARPGTAVADAALAEGLEGEPGIEVRTIRRRPARGLGVVQPHILRRSPA